jgi:hypothetical protein
MTQNQHHQEVNREQAWIRWRPEAITTSSLRKEINKKRRNSSRHAYEGAVPAAQ